MENFDFQTVGDLAVRWSPSGEKFSWLCREGSLFFLARWQNAESLYGLIGLNHPGIEDQREEVRQISAEVIAAIEDPHRGLALEETLRDMPGWGLVVQTMRGLRAYRDPIGRLPLMWRRVVDGEQGKGAGVVVGTRPAMVMGSARRIRRHRLELFLRGQHGRERDDFFQGVQRIRAGEVLLAERTGRLWSRSYWTPSPLPLTEEVETAAQHIGDALATAIEGSASRAGELISLSGGYDSTLLLLLFRELGKQPRSLSMVAKGTSHVDERSTIEGLLAAQQIEGEFFDIRGPQQWGTPQVHHPTVDFGPAFMAEAAYFRNFYAHARTLLERQRKPAVLVTGLGSDQLFYVTPFEWAQDQIWKGRPLPAVGSWRWRLKSRLKGRAKKWGLSRFPYPCRSRPAPPWMTAQKRRRDLQWRVLYDRHRWLKQRAEFFQSWYWEYTMRLLERYRRSTGLFVELPFLHLDVLRVGLSLPPSVLRARGEIKAPLRRLLDSRVPASFFDNRRIGCFDEVVWEGFRYYLRPSPQELIGAHRLSEYLCIDRQEIQDRLAANFDEPNIFHRQYAFELWHVMATELWLRQWDAAGQSVIREPLPI